MAHTSDGCLSRPVQKTAGATLYLMEELGDARLRCDQLMRYIDEAVKLIEKSEKKDHFMEVAGHLITGMPETAFKLQKALQAVALAADRIDYEELKQELRPEKVDELERVLKEVRIRPVQHRSENPMITPKQAAERLREFARIAREEGSLPLHDVAAFIRELDPTRKASASLPVADALDKLAGILDAPTTQSVTRQQLATLLSRMAMESEFDAAFKTASQPKLTQEFMQLGDVGEVKKKFKEQNPDISDDELAEIAKQWTQNKDVVKDKTALEPTDAGILANFETIKSQAIGAMRAANVSRWRQALQGLTFIVDEIGTILVKLGSMDTQKSEALKRELRQLMPQAAKNIEEMSEFSIQANASAEGYTFKVLPFKRKLDDKINFEIRVTTPDKKELSYIKSFGTEAQANDVVKDHIKGVKNGEPLREQSWESVKSKKANDQGQDPWKVDQESSEDKALRSRFEQGVPADPTENMEQGDGAEWKENTEEHKDDFKGKEALGPDGNLAKFKEGEPADPTENMSPEDAKAWKVEHDKNQGNFKAASDALAWKAV